ncbi:hypothetical protein AB0I39_27205 [Kitasatospora purpeofusca]|uniref:hypothetical protein n=1 Tax=Kitasatospora purpeofusca TaxID=67352 RepID=UPI003408AC22
MTGYQAPLFEAGEALADRRYQIYRRYLEWAVPPFANVVDILLRHGIPTDAAYTHDGVAVGAVLDELQLAAVRADPQVEYVDHDIVGGAAPLFRHLEPQVDRIESEYSVVLVEGTDKAAFIARTGITSIGSLPAFSQSIGAELTEQQIALLRRQPEVRYIEAAAWDYPD